MGGAARPAAPTTPGNTRRPTTTQKPPDRAKKDLRTERREFECRRVGFFSTLLGVAGIRPTLDEEDLTRCMHDCRDLVYCLVGALSDVASTTPSAQKREAMDRYRRVCAIVFR